MTQKLGKKKGRRLGLLRRRERERERESEMGGEEERGTLGQQQMNDTTDMESR